MQYELKKVAGIDLLLAPMKDINSVTVEILVKAGSLYETKETNGLSHFLEHMFFKGGKKYPTPQKVAETIDAIGGEFNAFTGHEYAGYYVKSSPEHIYTALDVLSDMMVDAQFPEAELEREKGVIIQELKMYEDRPDRKIAKHRLRQFYGDTAYGWDILGPEENILRYTPQDFFQHKKSLYTKDNIVIVIAGKITDQQLVEQKVAELFNGLDETCRGAIATYSANHPIGQRSTLSQNTQQNHFVLGGIGINGLDDDNYYSAKVLATIMGGGMSSRLFQEIREKRGLCYYIHCSHSAFPTHGKFMIVSGLSKENYQLGVDTVNELLATTAKGNITADELSKAKGNKIGSLQMGIETSDEMADFLGFQHLIYGKIDTIDELLEKYNAVTLENVNQLASMFHPDKLYGATIE